MDEQFGLVQAGISWEDTENMTNFERSYLIHKWSDYNSIKEGS